MPDKLPDWFPENPYPESVFPMTVDEYVEAIPDPKLRTAISGCLGRHFWQLAANAIYKVIKEREEDN